MVDISLVLVDYQNAAVRDEASMRYAAGGVFLTGWVEMIWIFSGWLLGLVGAVAFPADQTATHGDSGNPTCVRFPTPLFYEHRPVAPSFSKSSKLSNAQSVA